jgi:hypothetical protein
MWIYLHDSLLRNNRTYAVDVYEMSYADVISARLRNSEWDSVTTKHNALNFSALQLAHAIVKADTITPRDPTLPGLAFLLQCHELIDWESNHFSLVHGGTNMLSDFVRSSMTGRIGQGVAILFAQSRGYMFTSLLETHLRQHNHLNNSRPQRQIADFLFEARDGGRVVVESKATFSSRKNIPSEAKKVLKKGLIQQVEPWMTGIDPNPSNGYVVRTQIREPNQTDPTSIVFVDPVGDQESGHLKITTEAVRRDNYAGWLRAMGLKGASDRLRSGEIGQGRPVEFLLVKIARRKVAIALPDCSSHELSSFSRWLLFPDHGIWPLPLIPPVVGIDWEVLKAIAEAQNGSNDALINIDLPSIEPRAKIDTRYPVSMFSDGTVLFDIRHLRLSSEPHPWEVVKIDL